MRDTKRYQLNFYVHLEQAYNADNTLKTLRAFINSNILVFVWRPRFYLGYIEGIATLTEIVYLFSLHTVLSRKTSYFFKDKLYMYTGSCFPFLKQTYKTFLLQKFMYVHVCIYIGIIWKELRLNGMTNRFKVLIFVFSNILSWYRVIINNRRRTRKNNRA